MGLSVLRGCVSVCVCTSVCIQCFLKEENEVKKQNFGGQRNSVMGRALALSAAEFNPQHPNPYSTSNLARRDQSGVIPENIQVCPPNQSRVRKQVSSSGRQGSDGEGRAVRQLAGYLPCACPDRSDPQYPTWYPSLIRSDARVQSQE